VTAFPTNGGGKPARRSQSILSWILLGIFAFAVAMAVVYSAISQTAAAWSTLVVAMPLLVLWVLLRWRPRADTLDNESSPGAAGQRSRGPRE